MSSTSPAILAFLSDLAHVERDLRESEAFSDFLAQAERSSGVDPALVIAARAQYRLDTDPADVFTDGERVIASADGERRLAELVAMHHEIPRLQLIHAIWRCDSFDALRELMRSITAVVRYSQLPSGGYLGHIITTDRLDLLVSRIAERRYVLENGDIASDSITRALGLRAKVFALDRARRAVGQTRNENSLWNRLGRTMLQKSKRTET